MKKHDPRLALKWGAEIETPGDHHPIWLDRDTIVLRFLDRGYGWTRDHYVAGFMSAMDWRRTEKVKLPKDHYLYRVWWRKIVELANRDVAEREAAQAEAKRKA